jgi:hypothetical protein
MYTTACQYCMSTVLELANSRDPATVIAGRERGGRGGRPQVIVGTGLLLSWLFLSIATASPRYSVSVCIKTTHDEAKVG